MHIPRVALICYDAEIWDQITTDRWYLVFNRWKAKQRPVYAFVQILGISTLIQCEKREDLVKLGTKVRNVMNSFWTGRFGFIEENSPVLLGDNWMKYDRSMHGRLMHAWKTHWTGNTRCVFDFKDKRFSGRTGMDNGV